MTDRLTDHVTDLPDRLEASFGDGPVHLPVAVHLAAGRRALRRRRRRALVGAVSCLTAGAAIAFATLQPVAGAGGGIGPNPPPPSTTAAPIPVRLLVAPQRFVGPDTGPVLYLYGRMFKSGHDVVVLATYGLIDISTHPRGGAIVSVMGHTWWVAVVGNEPHSLVVQRPASYDVPAFRAWAQAQIAVLSGRQALAATAPGGYRPPVPDQDSPAEFDGNQLVAKPGGTVVGRVRHPLANEAAVRPCHDQAVEVHTSSGDWFVLGYDCPDGGALYSEPVGVRADSLTPWLIQVHHVQDAFEY